MDDVQKRLSGLCRHCGNPLKMHAFMQECTMIQLELPFEDLLEEDNNVVRDNDLSDG